MASVHERPSPSWSIDRLRAHFGGIPAERIRLQPRPGEATERDLIQANETGSALCELVDGTLVEKAVASRESILAGMLLFHLNLYLRQNPLGVALAPDGSLRLERGLVRLPDVSFISWEQIGADTFPEDAVARLVPELAVEIVSRGNTARELRRKVDEYLNHGSRLVWIVRPTKQTVDIHEASHEKRTIGRTEVLRGEPVLPGFAVALEELFDAFRRPHA